MKEAFILLEGDCLTRLRELPDKSVQCCVTSPPYWGLRDYGVAGQLGLEPTPEAYVARMVDVFREVRRVLRGDGTCWINLGDSYATGTTAPQKAGNGAVGGWRDSTDIGRRRCDAPGLKPKDLCGIPWRVAFALQADGWWLRQDIIWAKPNPMPESVTDRCTKAHEYVFLMAKSERYHYDAEAIKENAIGPAGGNTKPNKSFEHDPIKHRTKAGLAASQEKAREAGGFVSRNRRSVWTITTQPYRESHFATFPPDLIKPMILAGCPVGGVVLDPFAGSGTTGMVALELGRRAVLIELNPDYVRLIRQRTDVTMGMAL